ncbi:hypothetical protein OHC33_002918 [Knufia fluminis]|uniref:Uncharacterized protein n=1 Tax=Knufia fluminis TaxID=191047 RepID=A0AAN8EY55_9EURO|nr:hypothetical protein OHC33_002918 [Knufia fluminis]
MPGFAPAENGLFEIKLILTKEGLVFVNLDSSTMRPPFAGLKSKLPAPELQWKESFMFSTNLNWKIVARDFTQQVSWSQAKFRWAQPELEEGVWCTLAVMPFEASKTDIRCDVFGTDSTVVSSHIIQKWRARLEEEVATLSSTLPRQPQPFVYECGGRSIELTAILDQQSRLEAFSGTRTNPAFRFTGTDSGDFEAEALANALDRKAQVLKRSLQTKCNKTVDW